MSGTTIEAARVKEILDALPHRYPFLMVDRVIDMKGDESAIGIKNVTFNEPQFMGHFPGNPVFPGVLMIEGMAQTAGVMQPAASVEAPLTLASANAWLRQAPSFKAAVDGLAFRATTKPTATDANTQSALAVLSKEKNVL